MSITPPANSKIVVTTDASGYPALKLPVSSNYIRFPIAAFLVFWLGGWLMGEVSVIHELLSGSPKAASPFLVFWLGGWTIGGGFAVLSLYRMLRPAVPETLTLSAAGLVYDSGIPTPDFYAFNRYAAYRGRTNPWKKIFQKRKVITIFQSEMSTLRLREGDGGNRLTVDKGIDRIDLGESLSDVEKEWLYDQLKAAYRL